MAAEPSSPSSPNTTNTMSTTDTTDTMNSPGIEADPNVLGDEDEWQCGGACGLTSAEGVVPFAPGEEVCEDCKDSEPEESDPEDNDLVRTPDRVRVRGPDEHQPAKRGRFDVQPCTGGTVIHPAPAPAPAPARLESVVESDDEDSEGEDSETQPELD